MFRRRSAQELSYFNLLFLLLRTYVVQCDSNNLTINEPLIKTSSNTDEITTISNDEVELTGVQSEGKDIYIVFNDTDSTESYDDSTNNTSLIGHLSKYVPAQETRLAEISEKQHGGLGGHGHGGFGGHHNKIKIKKPKKKHKKKKKHGHGHGLMKMMMHPAMLIPTLIWLGFSPVLLANLKMFVMNALMINNMALSSAVFMTLRNMVFGPAPGPKIRYHNFGHNKPPQASKHYIPPEPHHEHEPYHQGPPPDHHHEHHHGPPPEHHHEQEPYHHGPPPDHHHEHEPYHHGPPPDHHHEQRKVHVPHANFHHSASGPSSGSSGHSSGPYHSHISNSKQYNEEPPGHSSGSVPQVNIHSLTQQTYNKQYRDISRDTEVQSFGEVEEINNSYEPQH